MTGTQLRTRFFVGLSFDFLLQFRAQNGINERDVAGNNNQFSVAADP